jgi:PAC2 family
VVASYELHQEPDLASPILVLSLEGWIDAGYAASSAGAVLLAAYDMAPVATFDADELLDHRARRPIMHLVEGVNTGLSWPGIELRSASDAAGNDLLFLLGAEPDHSWRAFTHAVVDLALQFGTRMVVGLGAYPAAVPHTRPTMLSITASTSEVAGTWPYLRGTLDVPAGVQAAIERRCAEVGLPAIGLWAQVPHYTSAMAYPAASLALLKALGDVAGLSVPTGDLADDASSARSRLDAIIADNPEHAEMVEHLEREADHQVQAGPIPSGDELAAELEQFLREQGD